MMKRFTLTAMSLMIAAGLFAQNSAVQYNSAKQSTSSKGDFSQISNTRSSVVSEDFEAWPPADWTIQDGPSSQGTQHWSQATLDEPYNGVAQVTYDDNGDATPRPQDEWLISPEFTVPANAYLRFDINTNPYWFIDPNDNADVNIKITVDGGTTWTQIINEHDIEGLESFVWKEVLLSLADYASETAQIAFQYVGQDAASCAIDNVEVFGQPLYDAQLTDVAINFNYVDDPDYHNGGNYHLSGHFARIPKPVLEESNTIMLFNAIVTNFGQNEANISCNVSILDPDDEEVYNEVVTVENMASGAVDTLDIGWTDETLFSMDAFKLGDYKVVYTVDVDGQTDENTDNNTQTVIVECTDGVYSRALGREVNDYTGPTIWTDAAAGDEMVISYHFMFPSSMEEGDYVEITSVDAYIHSQSTAGHAFNAEISYYDSNLGDYQALGSTELYILDEGDKDGMFNMTFADPLYVYKNDNNFVNVRIAIQVNDDPAASEYVLFGTEEVPTEGWSTQWILNGSSFGADPFSISNYTDEVPIVSLNVDFYTDINDNVFTDFSVYPNPTSDVITIENVENATVEVFNMMGEKVAAVESTDFRTRIDMSDLADGSYVVRVTSVEGIGVRKINLLK